MEEFFVYPPVWILEVRSGDRVGCMTARTKLGKYVFVFTDLDLAERFLAATGQADCKAIEVPSARAYLDFLEKQQAGCDRVAYDPPFKKPMRTTMPISRVIEDVRKRCE